MGSFRDLYKNDVDFAALSLQSKEFAQYLKPNGQLDFNDSDAVRQLTISLLKQDFGLDVKLPEDRLCPPVPNRLNYILWLHDIVESTSKTSNIGNDAEEKVIGLDIGTGCCSIYPLLGCKTRPSWEFVATDIDENNARTAQENVKTNQLESRIRVIKTDPKDALFPLDKIEQNSLDFTMCNPPFYTSREEMAQSSESKSQQPSSVCTGADVEMVTKGGEVAFVTKMIDESLDLRDRIQWYTSMLGKLSSVTVLVEALIKHGNHNYAVTEFVQGSKTKRWALAWSWGDRRPFMSVARGIPGFPKHLLPFPAEYNFTLPSEISIDDATTSMDKELESLRWFWEWDQSRSAGVGFATENVWSRQARRKMKLAGQGGSSAKIDTVPDGVALGIRVEAKLVRGQSDSSNKNEVQIVIHWIQGMDSVLFESFCGMLKRKLELSKPQASEK
ncbi:hypothetical protein N7509_001867 [Penicillium cosmopolitanum]|uniref:U6 small nuclear RNA (adenine-(43)-N(6))-methyltransferase n=1 Tax=Penicillium cosmopolitanum TaxID=1131564 RepID=A0A9X0BCY3_9EURO|nr:uncharacterized protein N7509_001867 [Penicillium cosmopolitanum]KAJ5407984.1 hypothetical protein N7509_001867 [Penicillium cosmopolitanum]